MSADKLPAGRELDALVAEKVMGWVRVPNQHPEIEAAGGLWRMQDGTTMRSNFSTHLIAAWLVVQRMQELGFWCEMRTPFGTVMEGLDDGYWAGFTPHGTSGWNGEPDHWTTSEALPLSICRAALKAVGGAS